MPLLSIVLFTPLAGLLVLLAIPSTQPRLLKLAANAAALLGLIATFPLLTGFDRAKDFQFVERAAWIPSMGAEYHLGIDGLALLMVVMTAAIGFLAILSSWSAIDTRLKEYYAWFLLQQTGMLGVFLSRDLLLFFFLWELTLIPMYFIIAIWGGPRRTYAAIKFVIYTLIGSVLMLLGILTLYSIHGQDTGIHTFEIDALIGTTLPPQIAWWIFWGFFAGFAVKIPMWPFHTWLPDAHVEAPTAGSVVLASILLKMGAYGFLRFSLPLLPDTSKDPEVIWIISALSIVAIIYGALVSLMQKDMKKLVAYSSVSHMGFCTLGIFALNPAGISGSILQQINHAVSTGLLFLLVGVIYERRHTREIAEYGGLLKVMPAFSFVFFITALSSMGMPPLNGFVGELAILQGAFKENFWWALACVIGIALGAAYLLWLFQRIVFGDPAPRNASLTDLTWREWAVLGPMLFFVFAIGLWPQPWFNILDRPVAHIVERVRPGYYEANKIPNPLVTAPRADLR
ncbi:MAG: NADH-quinone oxidoreductase subunit M [Acidobacteriota bacterium]